LKDNQEWPKKYWKRNKRRDPKPRTLRVKRVDGGRVKPDSELRAFQNEG
jgi:hypothetical protein